MSGQNIINFTREAILLIDQDLLALMEDLHDLNFSNYEIFLHYLFQNSSSLQDSLPALWDFFNDKNEDKLDIVFQYTQLLQLKQSFQTNNISVADWNYFMETIIGEQ